jgi:hypothetical protein
MIKCLPAIEKEFDMKEVANANPKWVPYVMIVVVASIIIGSLFL